MIKQGFRAVSIFLALFLGVMLAGCASGILDIPVTGVANPAAGVAVKMAGVTDNRKFVNDPSSASTPSLKSREIDNKAITARTIARKRSGFGRALGNIMLPEGKTVADVTSAVVARALRESGYRVLKRGEPGYEHAAPLNIEIDKFWAWSNPIFVSTLLKFEAQITIKGPVSPFKKGDRFTGEITLSSQSPTGRAWRNTIEKGLDNLEGNIKSRVQTERPGSS